MKVRAVVVRRRERGREDRGEDGRKGDTDGEYRCLTLMGAHEALVDREGALKPMLRLREVTNSGEGGPCAQRRDCLQRLLTLKLRLCLTTAILSVWISQYIFTCDGDLLMSAPNK